MNRTVRRPGSTGAALRTAVAALLAAAFPLAAASGTKPPATLRVSVSSGGVEGVGAARNPSISANGRFIAFESSSDNLVPGDTNFGTDIFVRDSRTAVVTRVSVDPDGNQLEEAGDSPSISASGRFVAFSSSAFGVVPGKVTSKHDIIVHDTRTGANASASTDAGGNEGDGESRVPAISANGRFVAFQSDATNLVPGDTNMTTDVFWHDLRTGRTVRVSVDSDGNQVAGGGGEPAISADGRFVAFTSGDAGLVPGDANGVTDIFVHDVRTGLTTRVSVGSQGQEGNDQSYASAISANGRLVAFVSPSTSLVPANVGTFAQVFLHDAKTGLTKRVSGFTADVGGDQSSDVPSITPSGRFVAFSSFATNMVSGDTNNRHDIFVHDVKAGTLVRASLSAVGDESDENSFEPSVSANGLFVAFQSDATNLVPGDANGYEDVFVRALK